MEIYLDWMLEDSICIKNILNLKTTFLLFTIRPYIYFYVWGNVTCTILFIRVCTHLLHVHTRWIHTSIFCIEIYNINLVFLTFVQKFITFDCKFVTSFFEFGMLKIVLMLSTFKQMLWISMQMWWVLIQISLTFTRNNIIQTISRGYVHVYTLHTQNTTISRVRCTLKLCLSTNFYFYLLEHIRKSLIM